MADDGTTYPNAPITEAVCDLRITREGLSIEQLAAVADRLRAEYPTTEEQFELSVQMEVNTKPASAQRAIGILGKSESGDRTCQVQLTGMSVSRLRPYDRWATFKTDAQRVWNVYREVVCPTRLERLALRYINRIDIPASSPIRLEDYFQTYIEVADDISTPMSNFFFQIHLPQNDIEAMCVINSGALPPAAPGCASMLLDIDIFKLGAVPQEEEEVWAFFDCLRDRKNQIFEACITDAARDLFR